MLTQFIAITFTYIDTTTNLTKMGFTERKPMIKPRKKTHIIFAVLLEIIFQPADNINVKGFFTPNCSGTP